MDNLQTNISTVSEEFINELFDGKDVKNIDENSLELGRSNVKVDLTDGKGGEYGKNPLIQTGSESIPYYDLEKDEVEEVTPNGEDKDEEEEDKTKKAEPEVPKKGKQPAKKEEPEEVKKPEAAASEGQEGVKEVLKNTVNFMIDKGLWKDIEDKDTLLEDLDEDGYAELVAKQHEAIIQEKVAEEINSTGDYGKAIIDYARKGGNPDELIDLFKEQKEVQSIAIDEEDGQKTLVEKYYNEVFGWSKDKVKKYINTLIAADELKGEAEEVQEKYTEHYKAEVAQRQQEQDRIVAQERENQKKFVQTINTKLSERKDFTDKDRKLIQESIFRYDKALADGTKVNNFYLKFAEMQKNPDDYLDLVKFVMDKKGYDEKVKKAEQKTQTEKKWSFIKGNGAVDKTTGSRHDERKSASDKSQLKELDFSSVLNR